MPIAAIKLGSHLGILAALSAAYLSWRYFNARVGDERAL